jgi:DNA (cytosine-5)-methyltransferase 1
MPSKGGLILKNQMAPLTIATRSTTLRIKSISVAKWSNSESVISILANRAKFATSLRDKVVMGRSLLAEPLTVNSRRKIETNVPNSSNPKNVGGKSYPPLMSFSFVDLFSGIGGFHGALSALGGKCVYASEIDKDAARIYKRNWGLEPSGDITLAANENNMEVPDHDVLVGGFPCQPFSKSGKQHGMEEARGTLFWNIAKIIELRKPKLVLLENVRNIAGPRHKHEWEVIIETLRQLGYRVSSRPLVVSPHRIHPDFGGRPQVRERIFIAATYTGKTGSFLAEEPALPCIGKYEENWNHQNWRLAKHLPLETRLKVGDKKSTALSEFEAKWIDIWAEFLELFQKHNPGEVLPGFPLWADEWKHIDDLKIPRNTPKWKANFLTKNAWFYTDNQKFIDRWLKKHNQLADLPPSRRKFEWQAQDAKSLDETVMHFRPSGIRVKKATYVPALVAITQTSILGKQRRRISTREGARMQGLPDWFDFLDQSQSTTFRQLGNGINIGAVYNTMKALVLRDLDLLGNDSELVHSILGSANSPDQFLSSYPSVNLLVHERTDTKSKDLKRNLKFLA